MKKMHFMTKLMNDKKLSQTVGLLSSFQGCYCFLLRLKTFFFYNTLVFYTNIYLYILSVYVPKGNKNVAYIFKTKTFLKIKTLIL